MASVIITGANGGLGQEVTNRLAEDGYHVLAVTGQQGAGRIYGKQNITSFQVDLMKEEKAEAFVGKAVETTSDLNAAVLLVGGFAMGKLSETSRKDLEYMIDLNFYTAFNLVRPLMKHFAANAEGGRFILVGARPGIDSSAGKDFFAYSLSKAMVIKMADLINAEGKDKNISATVIIPSVIDTAANRKAMPDADFSRWVPPQAIAETIAFYLSREGRMIREGVVRLYNRA